ncbi:hypothetical protein P154DRAFT_107884 [Amniculicola lignicola CBS 123094]|uniref:HD/PDEase domain-containing protein n=1 Tax=Amniculicola lignicola CBS 123094 TaxID=1392246 RepID=A0A6A5WZN3_9PLEO|nr:hypothetical protein P154DRAFT_107884 [Amniculicola lignicola CBS 123094]
MSSNTLIPVVPIRSEDKALFTSVNSFVHEYMSSPGHDNSHDYHHILRVVSNANKILAAELQLSPKVQYDTTALFLAALLHDVGDYKYAKPNEDVENQICNLLRERGASQELATKVQDIVKHVGYTNESKNPQSVVDVLAKYPELAIVQDADRLDAIGAVGVARCFTFGGARRQGQSMAVAVDHFYEKLVKLPGMMKTVSGKDMAKARNKLLEDFAVQFNEEAKLSFEQVSDLE